MAELNGGGSGASSPSKEGSNWVQFEEEDSPGKSSGSQRGSPAKSPSTSGVSSARGSVNSVSGGQNPSSPQGASIAVSEVQVSVDTRIKGKIVHKESKNMRRDRMRKKGESERNQVFLLFLGC